MHRIFVSLLSRAMWDWVPHSVAIGLLAAAAFAPSVAMPSKNSVPASVANTPVLIAPLNGTAYTCVARVLPASLPTADEARALCGFFGGRIPDEREWEAGARSDDGRLLPWGDRWSGTEANLCGRECALEPGAALAEVAPDFPEANE